MQPTAGQTDPEAVRAEILRQAEALFTHYGFWKTTMADIAGSCAMSPANLYRYYRNKQAIGLAVVDLHFHASRAAMEAGLMLPEGTAETRIRQMIRTGIGHLLREMDQNPKIVELAEFLCSDEAGIALLAEHLGWRRQRLAAEIARGTQSGELRPGDADLRAGALLLATKAFFLPISLAQWHDRKTVLPELDMVLDLIFDGLRREGA